MSSPNRDIPSVSITLHDAPHDDRETIVVIGPARGGTSAVAGTLRLLGVNMGENICVLTHEDLDFHVAHEPLGALMDPNHVEKPLVIDQLKTLIQKRNQSGNTWGWKDSRAMHYIEDIFPDLINPRLVYLFRDHYSVAQSEYIETKTKIGETFQRVTQDNDKMIQSIHQLDCPKLISGYEKVARFPFHFVRDLARFVGKSVDATGYSRAVDFLSTGKGYVTLDGESFSDLKEKSDEILRKHPELRETTKS